MRALHTPTRRVIGKVLRTVTGTVIFMVVIVLLFVALGSSTDYYKILTVLSGSMEPTLSKGALIVNVPVSLASVQPGDVITFQVPGTPNTSETHRVTKILRHGIQPIVQTKGDANAHPDPWRLGLVTEPAWKVAVVLPGLGYVFQWLRTSGVQAAAVVAIPVVLAVLWIRDIWKSSGYYSARTKSRLQ